jgi:hypothetical protein
MRVGAAMLPGLSLQTLHDLQGFAGLMQPRPLQPECLTLAEPKRQSDYEPHSIALVQRQGQDAVNLIGFEWIDFGVFHTWRLGQGNRVTGDVTALGRLAERSARGAVDLVRRTGLETSGLHPGIQLLEVLRLNTVDPMGAEAGYQVLVYSGAVAQVRLVTHRRLGDVLKPVS